MSSVYVFAVLGIGASSLIIVPILMYLLRGVEMLPSTWTILVIVIFLLLFCGFSITPWAVNELFLGGVCE